MTSAFARQADQIIWTTATGHLRFTEAEAERWLDLLALAGDCAMRAGDRLSAREARGLFLDLQDALRPEKPEPSTWPKMPSVQPITLQVREIDLSRFGDVG